MWCARAVLASALWCAAAATAPAAAAQRLPPEVQAALQRARVPATAISVVVQDAGTGRPTLLWRPHEAVSPASLAKLLTTAAALDMLGPAWRWRTPVWLGGPLRDGVLEGPLVIKGSGDPTLVLERVWLLLRRVQALGVREIRGDIVLDGSAFDVPDGDAGDFDGEPLRPYNVRPAALLLNFRSVIYTFVPDTAAGVARVPLDPTSARSDAVALGIAVACSATSVRKLKNSGSSSGSSRILRMAAPHGVSRESLTTLVTRTS